jgi:hypothetical protein
MNTYFLRSVSAFNELCINDQCNIINNLQEAYDRGNYISIRGEDMEDYEEVYATLYGCYQLTPDELSDYYTNGGEWTYLEPAPLYKEFTGRDL